MASDFDVDVTPIVEHLQALWDRHGLTKAMRIFGCERPHYPGVTCICGWVDDPPTPDPLVVASG